MTNKVLFILFFFFKKLIWKMCTTRILGVITFCINIGDSGVQQTVTVMRRVQWIEQFQLPLSGYTRFPSMALINVLFWYIFYTLVSSPLVFQTWNSKKNSDTCVLQIKTWQICQGEKNVHTSFRLVPIRTIRDFWTHRIELI